jgi:Domain of unknown function (DUF4157)/Bacterial protein of unknown function (DUF922)
VRQRTAIRASSPIPTRSWGVRTATVEPERPSILAPALYRPGHHFAGLATSLQRAVEISRAAQTTIQRQADDRPESAPESPAPVAPTPENKPVNTAAPEPPQPLGTTTDASGTTTVKEPPTIIYDEYSAATLKDVASILPKEPGSATFDIVASTQDEPISKSTVEVTQVVHLPRWKERDTQCAAVQKAWDDFANALKLHEDGHISINQSKFANAHRRYKGQPSGDTQKVTDKIKKEAQAANDEYDSKTQHGLLGKPTTIIDLAASCAKAEGEGEVDQAPKAQAKLEVSEPGDPYELEADRVADQVMRMAEPYSSGWLGTSTSRTALQRKCEECEEEDKKKEEEEGHIDEDEKKKVQRKASGPGVSVPERAVAITRSGGQPLDAETRAFMEPRFGFEFSKVRIHADSSAAGAARSINARAYTVGSDVAFAAGQYSPRSSEGRRLLAHELAHVVQQRGGSEAVQRAPGPTDAGAVAGAPASTSTPTAPVAPASTKEGPSVSQGPLGEVVVPLGNWTLFDHDTLVDKNWKRDLGKVMLYGVGSLSVPGITDDLKTELGLFGVVNAHANFLVDYGPGQLRGLQVGMSKLQALSLGAALVGSGGIGPQFLLSAYLGEFRAMGQLVMPGRINLGFGIAGELSAGAAVGGKEIVYLETGVGADATVDLPIEINQSISLYWNKGRLHLERNFELNPLLSLEFQLNAFIRAHLLDTFKWEKHWNLTKTPIDKWPIKIGIELHGDPDEPAKMTNANMAMLRRGKGVKVKIEQGELEPSELFKKVFKNAKGDKDKVTKTGDDKRDAKASGHKAPTGTQDDPIEMIWAKPLFRYENPIWLDTPNQEGREPFYRNQSKRLPGGPSIGADGGYFGSVGKVIQKGEKSGRGGQEDNFRKELEKHGYEGFSDGAYSPDHVLDLDWGGPDAFSNLWPLDRDTNSAAGRYHSFNQEVEFNLPDDPPEAAPRKEKLSYEFFRGRYFRIKKVADSKGL